MHLMNFSSEEVLTTKPRDFRFISQEPNKELAPKMIQWLPAEANNIKVKIRMPDASIVSGLGEPELIKLEKGDQLQFERFGFVRVYSVDKKKKEMVCWFSHR